MGPETGAAGEPAPGPVAAGEPSRLARFAIECRLGAGGMGVVYQAFDRERGVRVALKTLKDLDPQALYLFKREFRALADLHHPNLVSLGELCCEDGRWFFTMELVPGRDFIEHVRPDAGVEPQAVTVAATGSFGPVAPGAASPASADLRGPRPGGGDEGRLRPALLQLAEGLVFLHAAGKVHRDIKPSNVLVTPPGRVVLLDFGLIADAAAEDVTEVGFCGTPEYVAPEQVSSSAIGPEADWYSVGVILYRALTGAMPIEGAAHEVVVRKLTTEPRPPRALVPGVPEDLDALCRDLLRLDPAARPSGPEVIARLRAAGAGAGVGAGARPGRGAPVPGEASLLALRAPFVGRARELTALGDALARSRAGAFVVRVHGESGLGKTALVRRFLADLAERDPRASVLAGRCYERESVPFKAFDGLVDALSHRLRRLDPVEAARLLPRDRDVAALVRLFPVLGRVPGLEGAAAVPAETPDPAELRSRGFQGLRELLARLADRGPLVLFVDDLQWADRDSLVLLDEVLDPPDAPALLLVATLRAGGGGPGAAAAAAGAPCEGCDIRLEPLVAGEARELARILIEARGAVAVEAAAIAAEAKGHPLFIQELAGSLEASGTLGEGAGPRLDEVLRARVSRLDEPARRLVAVVALAGAPIPQGAAVEAAGLDAAEGVRRYAELRGGRLLRTLGARDVDPVETYHDRVQEAVVASLDAGTRRALYGRLADALERTGAADSDPSALVSNLEAAGETDRAARHAERAAERAARALAFDRAAELYRKALELGRPDPARARALGTALGQALGNAGRGREAAAAFLAAAEGEPPEGRMRCRVEAARQLAGSGHVEEGHEVVRGLLAEVGVRWPRTPGRAILSLAFHRGVLRLRGLGFRAREERDVPAAELRRADALYAIANVMAGGDPIRGAAFVARALRLALACGERLRIVRALVAEANLVATAGARVYPRVLGLVERVRELALADGRPEAIAHAALCRGFTAFFAGRLAEAERGLTEAEARILAVPGMVPELSTTRLVRLFVLLSLGRLREVRPLVHEHLRDAVRRGDRYVEASIARIFNVVWLAEDDPAGARRQLERRPWAPAAGTGYHLQHWYELAARSELALYEGLPGPPARAFDELDRSLLTRMQFIRTYAGWLRGRLALAAAPPALDEARRQAARLAREGSGPARAFGLLLRAGAVASSGGASAVARAAALVREAIAAAEADGLALVAAVARRRLGALAGGAEGAVLAGVADGFMTGEGIRRPDRLAAVYAPGFGGA